MNDKTPVELSPFDEFLDDFFAECDEHLTLVRQVLLGLEDAVPQGRADRAPLDELFRSFHSLKGLAAMVGVSDAEQIAHQVESYLRLVREGQAALTDAAIDALTLSTRTLEQVIAARRTQAAPPEIAPALAQLALLVQPEALPARPPDAAPALSDDTQAALALAARRGERVWAVMFTPTPDLAARGVNVNTVRERLQQAGELIQAAPRVSAQGGIEFVFLFASAADEASFALWAEDGLAVAPYLPPAPIAPAATNGQAPPADTARPAVTPSQVVRVDLGRLDELIHLVGELVITRARMSNQFARLEALLPVSEWRALQESSQLLERQLRDLRAAVVRVRMVPVGEVFARMQFVIRDLARELGRQVALELHGQETEIDKFVVERMLDPLLHLVRNAISHGLEPPEERRAAGKPAAGTVVLRAKTGGDTVVIDIEDDGRGIDRAGVAARARQLGLLDPQDTLDDARLLEVLSAPGFSTRDEADRISGRGVGLDAVQKAVHGLGGTFALRSAPGRGSCFTIQLPLTLAIVDALIVSAGGQMFAVPLPLVREVLRVEPEQITSVERRELMLHRGDVLPLVRLAACFRLPEPPQQARYAFVVGASLQAVGLVVDRLLGKREIVVRPITDPLVQVHGVAGATELGDGRPVLILDVAGLVARGT
jgi:two-component system chemotaxis sensor kinase CheA